MSLTIKVPQAQTAVPILGRLQWVKLIPYEMTERPTRHRVTGFAVLFRHGYPSFL
jgi:hypothetical protein